MTLDNSIDSFLVEYKKKHTVKKVTEMFNALSVPNRIEVLSYFSDSEKEAFVDKIRRQAVLDFWTHEKENIKNGTCTRAWTPEQIEVIMHISEKSGKELRNGAIAYFGE